MNSVLHSIYNIFSNAYYQKCYRTDWNIGYIMDSVPEVVKRLLHGSIADSEIVWFPASKKRDYIADPFVYKKNGDTYLFYEKYSFNEMRGKICARRLNKIFEEECDAITEQFHVSYPFLFDYENKIYLTLESNKLNCILLYESIKFPLKWKKKGVLLSGINAVDPTIYYDDKIWWLFFGNGNDKLYIYYTNNPLSTWQSHPMNPVILNDESARPAGRIIRIDNDLYRPSQDCSGEYGGRIVLNKIDNLTTLHYSEHRVGVIEPVSGNYSHGIHTISGIHNITFIDGKGIKHDPLYFLQRIRRKLRKICVEL